MRDGRFYLLKLFFQIRESRITWVYPPEYNCNGVSDLISISLCMIVKNEEDSIDRCLKSVQDIVDDFAAARNYAFRFATKDYIF